MLKHQGASIHTLNFRQYTEDWRRAGLERLTIGCLTTLGIAELGTGCQWVTELLAKNYQNLRHLRIGSEVELAKECAKHGWFDLEELCRFAHTQTFAELMEETFSALKEPSDPILRLESLSLVGLNFLAYVGCLLEPFVDFSSLTMLTLESCAGLETAFPLLVEAVAGRRKAKSVLRLHTFAIRHENASDDFLHKLENFLLSLKPLAHLHMLLEGIYEGTIEMRKVLRIHGKCLQSFIWDERTEPRNDVREDHAVFPDDYEHLRLVAEHCLVLKALGISLDWEDIVASEKNHKKVEAVPTLGREVMFVLISHRLPPHSPN